MELDPVTLPGSAGSEVKYWVAIQVTTSNNTTAYIETTTADAIGEPLAFSDGGGFVIPDESKEGVCSFMADCSPMSGDVFPAPYCGPLVFGTVEPITLVAVAGISNASTAAMEESDAHEDFVSISGEMTQGESYTITLEGNTVGDHSNRFVVYMDWNQNGILDDEGEVYIIEEELTNSTGTDGKQITGSIDVPTDALSGTTRMRVKKTYDASGVDPCAAGTFWGQTEDYSINISTLGISDNDALTNFSYYPNPAADALYLNATENIESVSVFNMLGQKVLDSRVDKTNTALDISNLSKGTYLMKVSINGQTATHKIIKD